VAGSSEAALQDKLAAQATLAASLQGQLDAANAQLAREREHGGQQQTTAAGAIAAAHAARDAAKHLAEQRLAQVRQRRGTPLKAGAARPVELCTAGLHFVCQRC
jgi:hypothetical protein